MDWHMLTKLNITHDGDFKFGLDDTMLLQRLFNKNAVN